MSTKHFNDKSLSNYGTRDMPIDGPETKNFKTLHEVYIEQHHQSNLLKFGVINQITNTH